MKIYFNFFSSLNLVILIIAILVILYAYLKKKIDLSAFIGSGIIGFIVILTIGVEYLLAMVYFFILGNLITRYKYSVKRKRKVAEGIRTFRNVFGNGGAAIIYAILYAITRNNLFHFAFLGAMTTATADTFATEVGEAHEKKPRLITNLRKRVNVGTPGAVSFFGTLGSFLGSLVISFLFYLTLFLGNFAIVKITTAGFFGCLVDSFIGATIERDKIDKHMTNFLATLSGGIIAIALFSL